MTAIEIYPQPEQELVLDERWRVPRLGDATMDIPGADPEESADWLMGFWEQLTDYMAEYADKDHLTEYVQRAKNQSGTRQ